MRRIIPALIAILAAGCFDEPAYPDGEIACGPDRACPDGFSCRNDDRCWRTTSTATCTAGERRCNDNQPQLCQDGDWRDQAECPDDRPVCKNGACAAGCVPGARRCAADNRHLEQCSAQGAWKAEMTCAFVCVGGQCGGTCTPGELGCSGDSTRVCDAQGAWRTQQQCPFVCATGHCSGECHPGAMRCSGGSARQICRADGRWGSSASCPFVCDPATGDCGGECTPGARRCVGNTIQICDTQGRWQASATCQVCSMGSCAPCTDGQRQCNANVPQRCVSSTWVNMQSAPCPYLCDPGQGCIGECVPGSRSCVGTTSRTCDIGGHWVSSLCPFVCAATTGACAGECVPGARRCNAGAPELCDAAGQWQSAGGSCPWGCDDATGMCRACMPEAMGVTCSGGRCGDQVNNCGQAIACGNSCGAPQTCGGGGVANQCGCTPITTCPLGANCGSISDGCSGMVTCGPAECGTNQSCVNNACSCTRDPNVCIGRCGAFNDNCGAQVTCPDNCAATGTLCGAVMPTYCG